jgi:hypothetical protein
MTENARLFFQMLERDLAGACDANGFTSATIFLPDTQPQNPYDNVVQFFTKADSATMTNQCVLVQYYISTTVTGVMVQSALCRQVINPATTPLPSPSGPWVAPSNPSCLFDMVYGPVPLTTNGVSQYRLQVIPQLWQPATQTFWTSGSSTPPSSPPYTHLLVKLALQYNDPNTLAQNAGSAPPSQNWFSKMIAIPPCF